MLALKGIKPLRWEGHPWLMRNKCAKARNTRTEVATEVMKLIVGERIQRVN